MSGDLSPPPSPPTTRARPRRLTSVPNVNASRTVEDRDLDDVGIGAMVSRARGADATGSHRGDAGIFALAAKAKASASAAGAVSTRVGAKRAWYRPL
jgi:hypothetical protein